MISTRKYLTCIKWLQFSFNHLVRLVIAIVKIHFIYSFLFTLYLVCIVNNPSITIYQRLHKDYYPHHCNHHWCAAFTPQRGYIYIYTLWLSLCYCTPLPIWVSIISDTGVNLNCGVCSLICQHFTFDGVHFALMAHAACHHTYIINIQANSYTWRMCYGNNGPLSVRNLYVFTNAICCALAEYS